MAWPHQVTGRAGWLAAQQVGAGVGQSEGPLEASHEDIVDAVAARSFIPLQERAGVGVRSLLALARFS